MSAIRVLEDERPDATQVREALGFLTSQMVIGIGTGLFFAAMRFPQSVGLPLLNGLVVYLAMDLAREWSTLPPFDILTHEERKPDGDS